MYKRKRKSKQQEERREEATGEEPTDTVAQPTPLQGPPSDEILPTTEAAIADEEEEQVPQNALLPVISKRCRLVTTFTDKEDAIIEFLQNHPEIYNKEHERYADKYHKEALWVEIATELKLDANDVKRWYTSKRTTFGKVSKNNQDRSGFMTACPLCVATSAGKGKT